MDALTGIQVTLCGLLVLGGTLKMWRPDPGRTGLARLGVRLPALPVRAIGLAEVSLGLAAALAGGTALWLVVTVAYVGFTAVGGALWKLGGVASCGCFGATETPPGPVHVAVTAIGAVFAAVAALRGSSGPVATAASAGLAGWATIASGLVLLSLVYLLLVAVPPLAGVVKDAAAARELARSARA